MKIVYFIDHLRPDGTQRVVRQLIEGLADRGHEQTVVCWNDSWDEVLLAALKEAGAEVRIVGKWPLVTGYGILATWRWLRREAFDVAVTFLFFSDVLGRTLAHVAGIPRIVSSIRARNVNYARWQRWLVRSTMRWADAVILNSAAVKDFVIREEGADPDKIHVIPNGLRVEDYAFPMSRATLRAEFGLPPDQILIGAVGRLTHQKGFDILIRALALLKREDVHVVLIGEGEERGSLQALAAELSVASRVHFAGYRRDVPRILGALDLYVQPSRFEGMPNALLEAMAAGCPVIASDVDGNRELIGSVGQGHLVQVEAPYVLANVICQVLNYGKANMSPTKIIRREFNVKRMIFEWESPVLNRVDKEFGRKQGI
jgi:glycosyltransferase involved in cell wall biosynthesis